MDKAAEEKIDKNQLKADLAQDELTAAAYLRQTFHVTDTRHADASPWEDELAAMDVRKPVHISEQERMLDADLPKDVLELFDTPIYNILEYDAGDAALDGDAVQRLVGDAPRVAGRTSSSAPKHTQGLAFVFGVLIAATL